MIVCYCLVLLLSWMHGTWSENVVDTTRNPVIDVQEFGEPVRLNKAHKVFHFPVFPEVSKIGILKTRPAIASSKKRTLVIWSGIVREESPTSRIMVKLVYAMREDGRQKWTVRDEEVSSSDQVLGQGHASLTSVDGGFILLFHETFDGDTRIKSMHYSEALGRWLGATRNNANPVMLVNSTLGVRFPSVGVDHKRGTVLVAYQSGQDLLEDGTDTGPDSDTLMCKSSWGKGFPRIDQVSSTNRWSAPSSVNVAFQFDTSIEKRPGIYIDPVSGHGFATWGSILSTGQENIVVAQTTTPDGDFCQWNSAIAITNKRSKNSDAQIRGNTLGTVMIAWVFKEYSILYSRRDARSEVWGPAEILVEKAFPVFQKDEVIDFRSDLINPEYWAVGFAYQGKFALVTSLDDGLSFSCPFVVNSIPETDYVTTVALNSQENGVWNFVYTTLAQDAKIVTTTSDELFKENPNCTENAFLYPKEFPDCLDVDSDVVIPKEYLNGVRQCFHIKRKNNTLKVHLELLIDMESEFPSCVFDYIAFRKTKDLEGTFLGPSPRICGKTSIDIETSDSDIYLFYVTDHEELGLDMGRLPFNFTIANEEEEEVASNKRRKLIQTDCVVETFEALQLAVDASSPCSEIFLNTSEMNFNKTLVIDSKYVVLRGNGTRIVNRTPKFDRLVAIGPFARVELYDLVFTQENDDIAGGAIVNNGVLAVLARCKFIGNRIQANNVTAALLAHGGAILNDNLIGLINDTVFESNTGLWGGAIAVGEFGKIEAIRHSTFYRNKQERLSAAGGAAIYSLGTILAITDTKFYSNRAEKGHGGAILSEGGYLGLFRNVLFVDNNAVQTGGAISINSEKDHRKVRAPFRLVMDNVTFVANRAGSAGGALRTVGVAIEEMNLTHVFFHRNSANACAGAICYVGENNNNHHHLMLRDVIFSDNALGQSQIASTDPEPAAAGLTINVAASVTLQDVAFRSNTGVEGGGLATNNVLQMDILDCLFEGNGAKSHGGALFARGGGGKLFIKNTSFDGNYALGTCREQKTCELSTLQRKRAECGAVQLCPGTNDDEGGIYAYCLETESTAPSFFGCVDGVGGGLYIGIGLVPHIHNCTFSDSQVPNVSTDLFTDIRSRVESFVNESGVDIYSLSPIKVTQTSFKRRVDNMTVVPIFPMENLIDCDRKPCASGNVKCERNEQTITCACEGVFEGHDAYFVGCRSKVVTNVQAVVQHPTQNETLGLVDLEWNFPQEVESFRVYRYDKREDATVDVECEADTSFQYGQTKCVIVSNGKKIRFQLATNLVHFFRVRAVMKDGFVTPVSESMGTGVIVCHDGEEIVPTDQDGESRCHPCPVGTYFSQGKCISCGSTRLTTLSEASVGKESCVASSYFYLDENETEDRCPEGVVCDEPGSRLQTWALRPGFWRPSQTSKTVYQCPTPHYCVNSSCATGHTGAFCESCLPGFAVIRGGCTECTPEMVAHHKGVFVGVCVVLVSLWACLVMLMTVYIFKSNHRALPSWVRSCRGCYEYWLDMLRAPLKIVIGFFQVLFGFERAFGDSASFVWANIDFMQIGSDSMSCYFPNTHFYELVFITAFPMLLMGVVLIIWGVAHVVLVCKYKERDVIDFQLKKRMIMLILLVIFLVYPSVSQRIFASFLCENVQPDGAASFAFLKYDLTMDCASSGYETMRIYSLVMLIIYPIGVPAVFLFVLVKHRNEIVQYNANSSSGTAAGFAFLFDTYNPHCYLYEVFEMIRKLFQISVAPVLFANMDLQIMSALVFTAIVISVLNSWNPYNEIRLTHYFALLCQWILIIVLFAFPNENQGTQFIFMWTGSVLIIFAGFILVWRKKKNGNKFKNCTQL